MKLFLYFALVVLLSVGLQLIAPWWTMPLLAGILSWIMRIPPRPAFLLAFAAAAFLWGGYAAYLNTANNSLLANRMGALFGSMGAWAMVAASALFAGLFTGLAGLLGGIVPKTHAR